MNKNNIDFFIFEKNLVDVFSELIEQLSIINKDKNLNFRIIDRLDNNQISLINILDSISVKKLEIDQINMNKYFFIIGNIPQSTLHMMISNKVRFEHLSTPINMILLINKFKYLVENNNNSLLELKEFSDFKYSYQSNTIYVNDLYLSLTDKENEIFQTLILNKAKPIKKKKLLLMVWNYKDEIDTHTLETHIYTLRKKIEESLKLKNLIIHQDDGYLINKKNF